jgi:putative ABC transport system substrate-binding protein
MKTILLLIGFIMANINITEAQQPTKIPRIGYVSGTGSATNQGPYIEALRQGLRDLGYVEGKNIAIEFRGAKGKNEEIPNLVKELVQDKVNVLVVPIPSAVRTAKQATRTIPIVIVGGDPVADGIVDSLARPGGNITGIAMLSGNISGKRLELIKQAIPRLSRVGVLQHIESKGISFAEYEAAARALKIQVQSLEIRGEIPDVERAFETAVKERVDALITVTTASLFIQRKRIAELAIKNRLPSMYHGSAWVESGGLMSYSANDMEAFRRAASYIDKILKGTKPADLPIEQPTKFEFVVNLKTAKQIGLTIPQSVLVRADRVIK